MIEPELPLTLKKNYFLRPTAYRFAGISIGREGKKFVWVLRHLIESKTKFSQNEVQNLAW